MSNPYMLELHGPAASKVTSSANQTIRELETIIKSFTVENMELQKKLSDIEAENLKLQNQLSDIEAENLKLQNQLKVLIHLKLYDAEGKLMRIGTILFDASTPIMQQIERILPFVRWKFLKIVYYRGDKQVHKGKLFWGDIANQDRDRTSVKRNLDYFKRNYQIEMDAKKATHCFLELYEKSERELEL